MVVVVAVRFAVIVLDVIFLGAVVVLDVAFLLVVVVLVRVLPIVDVVIDLSFLIIVVVLDVALLTALLFEVMTSVGGARVGALVAQFEPAESLLRVALSGQHPCVDDKQPLVGVVGQFEPSGSRF